MTVEDTRLAGDRLALIVQIRWAFAGGMFAYALAVVLFLGGSSHPEAIPTPVFLLTLPLLVVAQNLAVAWLAGRQRAREWAWLLCVAGDLAAVTIGLHGTGGLASWLWALYPLITLEAAFLTQERLATGLTAAGGVALYGAILACERLGWLPPVTTYFTQAEQALPVSYLAAKVGWIALVNAATATAGLAALSALARARGALEVAYARLAAQHAALRELDRLKQNVLSIVAHELRTPLAAAQGYAELAESDTGLTEEGHGYVAGVSEAIRRTAAKVDQMLAYATLADPAHDLRLEPTSARELLEVTFARQESLCLSKGLVLVCEDSDDPVFFADSASLAGALSALAENACQATPKGGTVGLGVRQMKGAIAFEVWDTGPGMPAPARARLGEAFKQAGSVLTAHAPGLGLGLAFARLAAERHGGTLEVSDRVGGGTRVRLIVPASPDPAAADGSGRSAQRPGPSTRRGRLGGLVE